MTDRTDLAHDGNIAQRSSRIRRWALAGVGTLALVLGGIWGARDRIAANVIDRELAGLGLPAQYRIDSIGLGREVLSGVVVGDRVHPYLTIERIEIILRYGLGTPTIDRITLVRPRIYGRLRDGRVHFGALDRLLYAPTSGAPVRLPGWTLAVSDARGIIDSDWGALGFSADGQGRLSDGFAGTVGVVVPQARLEGCDLRKTTLFAHVTTQAGRPRIEGPLRTLGAACGGTRIAPAQANLAVAGDESLSNWTIGGRFGAGRIDFRPAAVVSAFAGEAGLRWRSEQASLSGRITLDLNGIVAPALHLAHVRLDGVVHARPALSTLDFRGDVAGTGLARGIAVRNAMDRFRSTAEGSPIAPLVDRIALGLARQEQGNRLAGAIGAHVDATGWRVAVPSLQLRGGHGGQAVVRLDQVAAVGGQGKSPELLGKFAMGGTDLPMVTGTMNAAGLRGTQVHLAIAPYTARGAALAVPNMAITQEPSGALNFTGTAALSGPLGQGRIDGLSIPVEGGVTPDGRVAFMRQCATPRFERLRFGTLDLARGAITVCPTGGAVVRTNASGVQISAALPGVVLHGVGEGLPIAVRSNAVRVNWPGTSTVNMLDVTRGADQFRLQSATLTSTGTTLGGTFSGGDGVMAALPAKFGAASGQWAVKAGQVMLSAGTFTLTDRTDPVRFFPVSAQDATLIMERGAVNADLRLVSAHAGEELAQVHAHHDLSSGQGHADLAIAGIAFHEADPKTHKPGFQPVDVSDLAKGVIANANGTIKGSARIAWNANAAGGGVSGTGRFSSDDFDFAAAFGQVDGLSGIVEFTDLIHLVTAPHQHLKIASINPGIEVINGAIDLDLHENQVVRVNRAQWPFEGGTLDLQPTELHFGVVEPRRFTLRIDGLEAGRFLQHMNMSNLSATGTFDGQLPLVFDVNGGRIVGGQLVSRARGGNVSYVGALSYRDLSPMANFAFKMLRSVDYKNMTIGMDGDLGGEVVTKVSFGGISQGQGAERNLVTRQLAKLPIRFDINVRAQFYELISTLRSLYDPSMVPDPRDKGLVDAQGRPLHNHGSVTVGVPAGGSGNIIQHQASGTKP